MKVFNLNQLLKERKLNFETCFHIYFHFFRLWRLNKNLDIRVKFTLRKVQDINAREQELYFYNNYYFTVGHWKIKNEKQRDKKMIWTITQSGINPY